MVVERIFVSEVAKGRLIERDSVVAVAGLGIVGDRYFGCDDSPGRNITLIEAEEIESFLGGFGRPPGLSISRRNLVTRGVRLNRLVGREFMVGDVRLRGAELCEPCRILGAALAGPTLPAEEAVKRFLHRAGLRADVLSNGTIARGDAIRRVV